MNTDEYFRAILGDSNYVSFKILDKYHLIDCVRKPYAILKNISNVILMVLIYSCTFGSIIFMYHWTKTYPPGSFIHLLGGFLIVGWGLLVLPLSILFLFYAAEKTNDLIFKIISFIIIKFKVNRIIGLTDEDEDVREYFK